MNIYSIIQHAHSGLRWLVLILLLAAVVTSFINSRADKEPGKLPLFGMIIVHIQLLLGLILYFISPYVKFGAETMKDAIYRFYTVEHISLMLLAIILITVVYSRAKKQETAGARSRSIFIFYLIGLLLILLAIPWPMRNLGAGWF